MNLVTEYAKQAELSLPAYVVLAPEADDVGAVNEIHAGSGDDLVAAQTGDDAVWGHDCASSRSWHRHITRALTATLVVGIGMASYGCERFALDRQMAELCKKDGGVRVFETVMLPASMFDQSGDPFPGWRERSQEDRLGPSYRYVVETTHIKEGDPLKGEGRLRRTLERIYRASDGKLMGEAVSYGRSGGDFIAFAHPTSAHCPIYENADATLIRSTFMKMRE